MSGIAQPRLAEVRPDIAFQAHNNFDSLPTPHGPAPALRGASHTPGAQVPLLLKPNGVPVFLNIGAEGAQWNVTLPRNHRNQPLSVLSAEDQMQRTVKAHSFVVGKKITNVTEIAKTTCPEDQAMPVRIVYVKPGVSGKPPFLKTSNARDNELTLKKPLNINSQLQDEISLGDISGIFKDPKKRLKSAPADERKKRIEAQRVYAEQVRREQKVQQQLRQERDSLRPPEPKKAEAQKEEPKRETSQNVPHATNRYQGQYSKMTKDLFQKAQEKVREGKLKAKHAKELEQLRKDKEQQILQEIQVQNKEILRQQRERGQHGPSLALKEAARKQQEKRVANERERQRVKEARIKRLTEDRANLGLDQIDPQRLRAFQERKMQQQLQEDMEAREKELENMSRQRRRDHHILNSDLIDFTHPGGEAMQRAAGSVDQRRRKSPVQEDEESQPVTNKKQILLEMKRKRKQKDAAKKREEDFEEEKKRSAMQQLEEHLRQQRTEIARKQYQSMERMAKAADKQRKQDLKDQAKKPPTKKGTTEQLNDLRYWIEEQIVIEDNKKQVDESSPEQTRKRSLSPEKAAGKSLNADMDLLPGNSLIANEEEWRNGARKNRYGLQGDNGFDEVVQEQRKRDGLSSPAKKDANILDFTQKEASPQKSDKKSEGSLDLKPVKEPKRVVVNQALNKKSQSAPKAKVPGIANAKEEAQRQKDEMLKRDTAAATEIQKWTRGWQERKAVSKRRNRMKREVDYEHAEFTNEFKMNDQFNLNKFIQQKQKLRQLNQTEGLDESISENILESHTATDIQTQSYIPSQIGLSQAGATASRGQVLNNNFFKQPATRLVDKDPLSLISIFAKKHAAPPPQKEEQMIPERDRSHSGVKKTQNKVVEHRDATRQQVSKEKAQPSKTSDKKGKKQGTKGKQPAIEDEIEEDIEMTGQSQEQVTESIPSYTGPSHKESGTRENQSSSIIEESIQESLQHGSRENLGNEKQKDSVTGDDSIQEELNFAKEASAASVSRQKESEDISEESYLKDEFEKPDTKPKQAYQQPKPAVTTFSRKIDRIRENIEDDYDNDGFESYHGSLQADKLRAMQVQKESKKVVDYGLPRDFIKDFEEEKQADQSKNAHLLADLKMELDRYEKAVSGSIFIEQFQHTVTKSLAHKDTLMLAQRLSQLEQENKHKEEIARIREEQLKMMSQLMLLNAGREGGSGKSKASIQREQAHIMQNIQRLIEKPIIIQADASVELSVARESQSFNKSLPRKVGVFRKDSDDDIEEEIPSDARSGTGRDEDSIKESIEESRQSESKQLSSARRMLGSEQAIIRSSKELISESPYKTGSLFDRGSFGKYTSGKFKDLLLNEGTVMDGFLDEMEAAIAKRCTEEKRELSKQLQTKKISNKAYMQKQKDLERWVSSEKQEIKQKRAKVRDTCTEIGMYLKKIETDKKVMLGVISSASNTPRGKRSHSQLSESQESGSLAKAREQLRDIKDGRLGGEKPETRYLNKKRDFVRKLTKEKQEAIERGVKDKIKNYESDMIDELLQAALNLDVENEIEKRVEGAKQMVAEGRVDESGKSSSKGAHGVLSKSAGKKNVKFQSPTKNSRFSSSGHSQSNLKESSLSRSQGKVRKMPLLQESVEDLVGEDMIGESIKLEESLAKQSNKSGSRGKKSDSMKTGSAPKPQSSAKVAGGRQESVQKDDDGDSLSRDEEAEYSNDFVSESIHSGSMESSSRANLQSAQALQQKVAEIEESGYTEIAEDVSLGQSANKFARSSNNQIQTVNEEEDQQEDSSRRGTTEGSGSSPGRGSSQIEHSGELRDVPPSPPKEQTIDILTDIEVSQSTKSVDWQIVLQDRQRFDQLVEEEYSEEPEEDLQSEVMVEGLEDLDSCPSGSLDHKTAPEADFEVNVDQITDELLNQILRDFSNDQNLKMNVEDIDEEDFLEKWPWTLDKPVPELPAETFNVAVEVTPAEQEEARLKLEKERELEAKLRHDALMAKFHEEQQVINDNHKRVVEYLDFLIQIVDKEVLQHALQKPIEHDPLRILEKIQAYDTEDEIDITAMAYSQQQSALPPDLFDEIEKRFEEVRQAKEEIALQNDSVDHNQSVMSQETRNIYHLGIFDAFNEALDQERPYRFKGLPNPWSRQTRVTTEQLTPAQVDLIIQHARDRVIEWDKTGAGTKFAPPPPPPPPSGEFEPISQPNHAAENEEERNKAERQERLGQLLTKEVHQREDDWLDYEIEDTQVRFDLADMILEELADEITQFMAEKHEMRLQEGEMPEEHYNLL